MKSEWPLQSFLHAGRHIRCCMRMVVVQYWTLRVGTATLLLAVSTPSDTV